jgi:hypothetical protein
VHGLSLNDLVSFRAEAGAPLAPLAEGTTYYAVPLTEATFSRSVADDALNLPPNVRAWS